MYLIYYIWNISVYDLIVFDSYLIVYGMLFNTNTIMDKIL